MNPNQLLEQLLIEWFDAYSAGNYEIANQREDDIINTFGATDSDIESLKSEANKHNGASWLEYANDYSNDYQDIRFNADIRNDVAENEDFWDSGFGKQVLDEVERLREAYENEENPILKEALLAQLNSYAPDSELAEELGLEAFDFAAIKRGMENEWDYSDPSLVGERVRWASQCFLIAQLEELAKIHPALLKDEYPYKKVVMVGGAEGDEGQAKVLINKLSLKTDNSEFLNIKPHEISQVYPKIEIYKVVYEKTEKDKPRRFLDEIRFPFPAHSLFNPEKDVLKSSRNDFGIKNVSWSFNGLQPATVDKDITARVTFYFQGFDVLVEPHVDHGRRGNLITWNYLDLLGFGKSSAKDLVFENGRRIDDGRDYEIRLIVGYNFANSTLNDELNTTRRSSLLKSFEAQTSDLYLQLTDHNISYKQDGTILVSCDFRGRIGTMLQDPKVDVLSDRAIKSEMVKVNDLEEKLIKQGKKANKQDLDDLRAEKEKLYAQLSDNRLSKIIEKLENKEQIYNIKADPTNVGQFASTGIPGGVVKLPDPELVKFVDGRNYSDTLEANFEKDINNLDPSASDAEVIRNRLTYVQPTQVAQGDFAIPFMYFGDLLESIIEIALEESDVQPEDEDTEDVSFPSDLTKNFRILLGPIEYQRVLCGMPKSINMASIPISMDLFVQFFYETVITSRWDTYPIKKFMTDIANKLILSALGRNCLGNTKNGIISIRGFPLELGSKNGGEPFTTLLEQQSAATQKNILRISYISPLSELGDQSVNKSDYYSDDLSSKYQYYVFYAQQSNSSILLSGDPNADKTNGVHHVYLGKNRGLVKSIDFQKAEIPLAREIRFQQIGQLNPHYQLSNRYNANISMHGNNLFLPGTYVYINPLGMGTALGNPSDRSSISRGMGLGGYHVVVNVQHSIQDGLYQTSVQALWESSGGGSKLCGEDS